MKYAHLIQIADFLSNFKKILSIKRVGDMLILAEFNGGERIFFDLAKSGSAIYKDENFTQAKIYQAPFDNVLKKRLNQASLQSVQCLKDNRILKFSCTQSGSYKSTLTHLYLEFTGRFTNAIVTDEKGVILEALRHISNSSRKIEVGEVLQELEPISIREKEVLKILNFDEYFKDEFNRLNERNLSNLRAVKLAQICKKIDTINQNLRSLENEKDLREQSEILSSQASVLLANLSQIKEHERKFYLKDFNGKDMFFELEASPKISANAFYTKAKRLRAKAAGAAVERENLEEKIKFYENLRSLLQRSNSIGELEILYPKRSIKTKQTQKEQGDNIQSFFIKEFKILVGKNEKGNEQLLKNAKKDDIWMHVKDIPSAHVIIKTSKAGVPDDVLKFGAKICLNFSVTASGKYEIDYTKRHNVKIISGSNVNYIDFKTIIVIKE